MIRPSFYNPASWYWVVAGSTTQVYSSAAVAYVPTNDATYIAWLQNNDPTAIAVEQDLFDLLAEAGVNIPAGAAVSDASKTRQISKMDMTVFKILFSHENRIRALAGQPSVTKAQFITAVKALM